MWRWEGADGCPGREVNTYGDIISVMASTTTREGAQAFLEGYRQVQIDAGYDAEVADKNIGFGLGEFSDDEYRRLQALFGASHPVFGTEPPTDPMSVFEAGMIMGSPAPELPRLKAIAPRLAKAHAEYLREERARRHVR